MLRRISIFVYGVLAYAAFFAVFCYLFAFANNLWVPKSIDSATGSTAFPSWLGPALLVLFGVQHAVMARPRFKRWFTSFVPAAAERSTYVLITSAILAGAMATWQPIPGTLWSVTHEPLRYALLALSAAGYLMVLISSFLIDHFDLFGLRQVTLQLLGRPYSQRAFAERSFYRIVRHPLMLGFLIWMWATPDMTVSHLVFASLLSTYIGIGLQLEERDLVSLHGANYRAYQERVPMLLPRLGLSKHPVHAQRSIEPPA